MTPLDGLPPDVQNMIREYDEGVTHFLEADGKRWADFEANLTGVSAEVLIFLHPSIRYVMAMGSAIRKGCRVYRKR